VYQNRRAARNEELSGPNIRHEYLLERYHVDKRILDRHRQFEASIRSTSTNSSTISPPPGFSASSLRYEPQDLGNTHPASYNPQQRFFRDDRERTAKAWYDRRGLEFPGLHPQASATESQRFGIPPSNTLPFTPVSGWTDELQVHPKLEETTMRPASTNPSMTSRHSGIPLLNTILAIDLNEESRDVVEENTDVAENRKDSADLTDDESVDPAPGSKGKEKRYA
jgi:hypothetical protein